MSANSHEEAHTGPIKTPKQLLVTVFLSFVAPIFIIIGLVYAVVSGYKPAGSNVEASMSLGGLTTQDRDQMVASRIQKVGSVEIRDANRALRAGEEVFKAQCIACHGAPGIPGAPHLGDVAAWAARIKTGYDALHNSALKGKGAMPPQGGGDFDDIEIGRAVVYLSNAAGGSFPIPDRPAAAAPEGAASAPAGGASAPTGAASAAPAAAATASASASATASATASAPR